MLNLVDWININTVNAKSLTGFLKKYSQTIIIIPRILKEINNRLFVYRIYLKVFGIVIPNEIFYLIMYWKFNFND